MTDEQKKRIIFLRQHNVSFVDIANELRIPAATVKTFCYRKKIVPLKQGVLGTCEQCNQGFLLVEKRKPRRFCSDKCRMKWWNSHRDLVNPKGMQKYMCNACGRIFMSYARNQKYCSRDCYYGHRFGKGQIVDV